MQRVTVNVIAILTNSYYTRNDVIYWNKEIMMSQHNGKKMNTFVLLISFLIMGIVMPFLVHAGSGVSEKAVGIDLSFYSGTDSTNITAPYSLGFTFSSNSINSSRLNLVNRFGFHAIVGGKNFLGSYGNYSGFLGNYEFGLRFNLSKEGVLPYIELGPLIGMYIIRLSGAGSSVSTNQTSFKYGYTIGTGFDWIPAGGRGSGHGWGFGINYFTYLQSLSMFEFSAGPLSAKGIVVEFRRVFSAK